MNPALSPNDEIRRNVMAKEILHILRRLMPPPQVDALIRRVTDHDSHMEAVADAIARHVDMACFRGSGGHPRRLYRPQPRRSGRQEGRKGAAQRLTTRRPTSPP